MCDIFNQVRVIAKDREIRVFLQVKTLSLAVFLVKLECIRLSVIPVLQRQG